MEDPRKKKNSEVRSIGGGEEFGRKGKQIGEKGVAAVVELWWGERGGEWERRLGAQFSMIFGVIFNGI